MKNPFSTLDQFFFKPESVSAISIYRIVFALLVCQLNLVHLAPDLFHWYGKHGVVSIENLRAYFYYQEPRLDLLLLLPNNDFAVLLFFTVYCLAGISLLFGFQSRICSVLIFVGICTLHHHNPYNINSGDGFMRLAAFFLMFTPCGGAYSIDRLLKSLREDWRETGFEPDRALPWAQRLIQIQLSLLYTQATYVKSLGLEWQNGDAVYYASRHDDLMRVPLPFLFDNPLVWRFLTWSTLVIEFALGVLIWIKPLRYWLIALGVGLHLGIDLSMNIPMFEWLMITAYILFIEPCDLERGLGYIKSKIVRGKPPSVQVLYDSNELYWIRIAGLVRRLDVFGRVELCDLADRKAQETFKTLLSGKQLQKFTVVEAQKRLQGFDAFVHLCLKLPLLHLLLPVVHIPVSALISRLTFDRIWSDRERVFGNSPASKSPVYLRPAVAVMSVLVVCGLTYLNVQASRSPLSDINMYDAIVAVREDFARKELGKTLNLDKVAAGLPEDAFLDPFSSLEKNKKVLTAGDISKLSEGQRSSSDADKILKVLEEQDAASPPVEFPAERLKGMSRLADVYWQSNRLSDAESLLKYVWKMRGARVKVTGNDDPELLATMLSLGDLYRDWGWYDKSISCYKQALGYMFRFSSKVSGAQVMASRANLALIYYLAGQSTPDSAPRSRYYGEARTIYNEILPYYSRKYGDASSRYGNIRKNEALLRRDGG